MKSNKQRRAELKQSRLKQSERDESAAREAAREREKDSRGSAPVNRAALAPHNSYFDPDFAARGYYLDQPFTCVDCGKDEVWTATQQKWWYEVAKGDVFTTARRCRICRRRDRERRTESRRVHLEGIARKEQKGV
jgi:hypothetical protein